MERRDFLKNCCMTIPLSAGNKFYARSHERDLYHYPAIKSLIDVETIDGHILVRIKFTSRNTLKQVVHFGKITVEQAQLVSITPCSFEAGEDIFDPTDNSFRLSTRKNNSDIFLVRLKNVCDKTTIHVNNKSHVLITLVDILKSGYVHYEEEDSIIEANFLLDKEIGEIELSQIGIDKSPRDFSFFIFADPQGGDPECPANHRTRMKIHNAFIEDSIVLANHIPERPLFTLILGDIVDSQGEKENFQAMFQFWQKLDSPILYELGNHESRYSSTFEPGYDMSALQNYFSAQKSVNGLDKILYSFNAGDWHFVVWPDPLRSYFWDNHPHYFEWLENDLAKYKDRPTFVFHHVPCHPIGISPFQGYLEQVSIRKKFVDIVTKNGNVKYVLSGHIHIPVKSSLKTACRINGTNFITLPAAGYRPRGFGEQDYCGGPSQGIAIVRIRGEQAKITFKTVMEEELTFPEKLEEFNSDLYKFWFNNKWDVEAGPELINGNFAKDLDGWIPEVIYKEDKDPSVICESRHVENRTALYMYNRIRDYQAPGQDRLPQTINRISQVILNNPGKAPELHFEYKLDKKNCDLDGLCGGYLWIEGYCKSFRQFNLVYSAGKAFANPVEKSSERVHEIFHFDLPNKFDWTKTCLNLQNDFNTAEKQRRFQYLDIDRIVITLGVWTVNEGESHSFGIYFTDFEMLYKDTAYAAVSMVRNSPILTKKQEDIWWQGKDIPFIHLAGEHRYYLQTTKNTLFKKEFERFR